MIYITHRLSRRLARWRGEWRMGSDNLPLDSFKVQEKIDNLRSKP